MSASGNSSVAAGCAALTSRRSTVAGIRIELPTKTSFKLVEGRVAAAKRDSDVTGAAEQRAVYGRNAVLD
jgi:hypothetical protein